MSVSIKNRGGEWVTVAGNVSNSYAPIGAIYPFGGTSAPSGYLLCNGQAISRTDYAALFAVIGTSFGAGDGSTTFNVPDLRETVPVGSGTRGSGVTAHDTYTVGQFKDDQKQTHTHSISHTHTRGTMEITGNLTNYNRTNAASGYYNADGAFVHTGFKGSYASSPIPSDDINVEGIDFIASQTWTGNTSEPSNANSGNDTGRTGTTTHGKQLGVNYIIKAKDVNLSVGGQALADRVEALEAYGKKVLWTGTATKGDTIAQFSVQGYDEVIAQVGGTWIRLDSGHGVGANGRKKFTGLYAGRDTVEGAPYEQYYLLDILGTGYIADCAWFNVGSLNIQNARLAGQKAIECITNSAAWSDPTWKSLADVETNVNVTRIIGIKYPLIG